MDATEDALAIIEEEAKAVGQFFRVKDASRFARMLGDRVAERLGGRINYIRNRSREAQAERNAEICREFNGRNYDELALKHDLTERQVRKIVKACPLPKVMGE